MARKRKNTSPEKTEVGRDSGRKRASFPAVPLYRGDPEAAPFFGSLWKPLLVVLLVAGVARLVHFFFIRANDPSFAFCISGIDTYTYDQWALKILKGDWLSRDQPVFYYGPVYPYFLASVYGVFGHSYSAVHIVQFLLGTLTSGLVFLGAAQWFSRRVAFVAGLAMGLCSGVLYYEGTLLPEAVSFFAIAGFLCMLGLAQNYPQRLYLWPLMGLVLGAAVVQRANMLLCVGGVTVWALIYFRSLSWGRRLAFLALFGVGLAGPLSLTFLHNLVIGKQAVLVTSNGPNLFYIGNAHDSDGTFAYPPSFLELEEERKTREVDIKAELIKSIRSNPGHWVSLMGKKFYLFWAAFDTPDNFSYDLFRMFSPVTRRNPVGFSILAPLAFIGIGLSLRRWNHFLALYLFLLTFCASIVLVFIVGRYRLHIITGLAGFSALAIWYLYGLARSRRYGLGGALLGAVVAIFALLRLYSPVDFRIRPNDFVMGARYYGESGRLGEAAEFLGRAAAYYAAQEPKDEEQEQIRGILVSMMYGHSASYLMAQEKWVEAETLLRLVVDGGRARPKDFQMLVQALAEQKKMAEAIDLLENLARSNPGQVIWQQMLEEARSGKVPAVQVAE